MSEDGLINIKFTPGPKWSGMTHDEKCGALADFLEAEKTATIAAHSGKPQVDARELVRHRDCGVTDDNQRELAG